VITVTFSMKATNVLPDGAVNNPAYAGIAVYVNNAQLTSATLDDAAGQLVNITTEVPYTSTPTGFDVAIKDTNADASGNDFGIRDVSLVQDSGCHLPEGGAACDPTDAGLWYNYTGNWKSAGVPPLTDPNWHAVPALPNGQHQLALQTYGFDTPYQVAVGKGGGNGNWFLWRDVNPDCWSNA
jgi:hypothetical protein